MKRDFKSAFRHFRQLTYDNKTTLLCFLFLTLLDVLIFLFSFSGINIFTGSLAFGNLPSFYLYGFTSSKYFIELILYPVVVKLISQTFNIYYASSLVYFSFIFLPSFSIFFFVNQLTNKKLFSILISLMYGTIINPLFLSQFVGGSFMVFSWLFFLFLSFGFLIKFLKVYKFPYLVISAILYTLSITSGGFFPVAVYLSFPFVIGIFLTNVRKNKFKSNIINFGIFAITTTLLLLPQALNEILPNVSTISSQSSKVIINEYIRSVINFEYIHFNLVNTLMDNIYMTPNGYLNNWYWSLLTLFILISTITYMVLRLKSKNAGIIYVGLGMYLISSSIIILFHYGIITSLFLKIVIFDQLDYPYDFLFMQQIALIMMSLSTLEIIPITAKFILKHSGIKGHVNLAGKFSSLLIIKKLKEDYSIILVLLLAVILVFSSIPIVRNTPTIFHEDQSSPFIPSYYNNMHAYLSSHDDMNKEILLLPNTEHMILFSESIIESKFVWNPPQPLPSYGNEYNISEYAKTLSLLSDSNYTAFTYLLALSGVKLILVLASSENTILIPSGSTYSTDKCVCVNTTELMTSLNKTKSAELAYKVENLYLYNIDDSIGNTTYKGGLVTFKRESPTTIIDRNILTNTTYTKYGEYGSGYDEYIGNRTYSINYNATENPGYNMLWLNAKVNNETKNYYKSYNLRGEVNFTKSDSYYFFVLLYSNNNSLFWNESSKIDFKKIQMNDTFNYSFDVPSNTVSLNTVFYITGNNTSNVIISNITLSETLGSIDASKNISLQFSIYNNIKSEFNNTLFIPNGFGQVSQCRYSLFAVSNVPYIKFGQYYVYQFSFPSSNIQKFDRFKVFASYSYVNAIINFSVKNKSIELDNIFKSYSISVSEQTNIYQNLTFYSTVQLNVIGVILFNNSFQITNMKLQLPEGYLCLNNGSLRDVTNISNFGISPVDDYYAFIPFVIFLVTIIIFRKKIY